MTAKPKVRRVRRDPADKAAEALAVAERRVAKLFARREALHAELDAVEAEYDLASEERDYLSRSPHLTRQAGPQAAGEPT